MVKKMKVDELKGHLRTLGLDTAGLKHVLMERLLSAVQLPPPTMGAPAPADDSSESDDDQEWKVKRILGRRVVTHIVDAFSFEVVEYQVQWDWPDEDDPSKDEVTWEKETNLTHAHEAMFEFLASQPKQPNCEFGHLLGVCRCSLPLIHAGQDEFIFKAYQKSAYQWVVQGVRGLRTRRQTVLVKWYPASRTRFGALDIHYPSMRCSC